MRFLLQPFPQPFPFFATVPICVSIIFFKFAVSTLYMSSLMKYVTIIDIARELQLSKSTVSRALSGSGSNVKPETMQRIVETARKMGYQRNELAVNLRKQSTKNIGIVIPEATTPFFMHFIQCAQKVLRQDGYKVIIAISNEDVEQESENLLLMEQCRVDGILMSVCHNSKNCDMYHKIINRGIPIVLFDRTIEDFEASQVMMDDYLMAFFMVEAMIRRGYKKIIHLAGPSHLRNSYARKKGYQDALEKFGIAYDKRYVIQGGINAHDGSQAMEHFLAQNIDFDAIFGFTEAATLGVKSVLQMLNYSIPLDVAICCISGTELSTLVHPTITTVEQPVSKMAEVACRLLLKRIQQPELPHEEVKLRGEMIFRESMP